MELLWTLNEIMDSFDTYHLLGAQNVPVLCSAMDSEVRKRSEHAVSPLSGLQSREGGESQT